MEKELKKIDDLLANGVITSDEHKLLRSKIIDKYLFLKDVEKKEPLVKETIQKKKFKIPKKVIIYTTSFVLILAIVFGIIAIINKNQRLEEEREFALVQERFLTYMDSSSEWICEGGVEDGYSCRMGDVRVFTFGSYATIISVDRKFGDTWVTVHVNPDGIRSGAYGTYPYYNCEIRDVGGVVTVTFDEAFSGMGLAIERITALYLIAKEIDQNS